MRKLLSVACTCICFFSASIAMGESETDAAKMPQKIEFRDGANAEESRAISEALVEEVTSTFKYWFTESHFPYGPSSPSFCDSDPCLQHIVFGIGLKVAALDLNGDQIDELIVTLEHTGICGMGGCKNYVLQISPDGWKKIGSIFTDQELVASSAYSRGFRTIQFQSKYSDKIVKCAYEEDGYSC